MYASPPDRAEYLREVAHIALVDVPPHPITIDSLVCVGMELRNPAIPRPAVSGWLRLTASTIFPVTSASWYIFQQSVSRLSASAKADRVWLYVVWILPEGISDVRNRPTVVSLFRCLRHPFELARRVLASFPCVAP